MNRRRMMLPKHETGDGIILPDAYQRVKYIEADNSNGTKSFLALPLINSTNGWTWVLAVKILSGSGFIMGRDGTSAFSYRVNATSAGTYSGTNMTVTTEHTTEYDIVSAINTGSSYSNNAHTGIMAVTNTTGEIVTTRNPPTNFRLYYAILKNTSGTIVRHLIPCYRKSDGVIGAYDIIRNTFLTNVGDGTFTKGGNI